MVCTNPDLIVHHGSSKEYCAGTLAAIFEELGGKVVYFGKPYPAIYNFCTKKNVFLCMFYLTCLSCRVSFLTLLSS